MVLTRINNNVSAFNAARNLGTTSAQLGRSLERLSSGLRINRAADDAAGLSISESQRSQIRGLSRAIANAQDAISLVNTAEGALNETTTRLQRMRELAVQASNTGGNDAAAIQAIQDEIEQSIAEITRIADTTQFGTRKVLNGSAAATATVVTGTSNGASVATGPVSTTLQNGAHLLQITQTQVGSRTFQVGADGVNNSNAFDITNSTFDSGTYQIVVSNARAAQAQAQQTSVFGATSPGVANIEDTTSIENAAVAQVLNTSAFTGTGALTGGDSLTGAVYLANTLAANDTFTFTGVDADGNAVSGVYTVTGASTLSALVSAISAAYSGATASLNGNGEIVLTDDAGGVSTTTLTITLGGAASGNESAAVDVAGADAGAATGGAALVGLTFAGGTITGGDTFEFEGTLADGTAVATGTLAVSGGATVSSLLSAISAAFSGATATLAADGSIRLTDDATGASQTSLTLRVAGNSETSTTLTTGVDATSGLATGDTLVGSQFAGATFASGSTVGIAGTDSAGNAVTASFAVTGASTLGDLVSAISNAFTGSTATYSGGRIILTDDATGASTTSLQLTLGSATDNAVVTTLGAANSASVSVGGGAAQTVSSGDTVTFYGASGNTGVQRQITMTLGALSNGSDSLTVVADVYSATLDGGNAVSFQNGDQNVRFIGGSGGGFNAGGSVNMNFDTTVSAGNTIINVDNKGLNFQIGANAGQSITVAIGNLAADQIGFASTPGRSVADIDVTSLTGAQDAIRIIDEAIGQVNRQRSALGATTNRLESTIANLGVAQENLTAAESRIRDADVAFETTQFTRNQILVQAGVSILAQANVAPQSVLQLLG